MTATPPPLLFDRTTSANLGRAGKASPKIRKADKFVDRRTGCVFYTDAERRAYHTTFDRNNLESVGSCNLVFRLVVRRPETLSTALRVAIERGAAPVLTFSTTFDGAHPDRIPQLPVAVRVYALSEDGQRHKDTPSVILNPAEDQADNPLPRFECFIMSPFVAPIAGPGGSARLNRDLVTLERSNGFDGYVTMLQAAIGEQHCAETATAMANDTLWMLIRSCQNAQRREMLDANEVAGVAPTEDLVGKVETLFAIRHANLGASEEWHALQRKTPPTIFAAAIAILAEKYPTMVARTDANAPFFTTLLSVFLPGNLFNYEDVERNLVLHTVLSQLARVVPAIGAASIVYTLDELVAHIHCQARRRFLFRLQRWASFCMTVRLLSELPTLPNKRRTHSILNNMRATVTAAGTSITALLCLIAPSCKEITDTSVAAFLLQEGTQTTKRDRNRVFDMVALFSGGEATLMEIVTRNTRRADTRGSSTGVAGQSFLGRTYGTFSNGQHPDAATATTTTTTTATATTTADEERNTVATLDAATLAITPRTNELVKLLFGPSILVTNSDVARESSFSKTINDFMQHMVDMVGAVHTETATATATATAVAALFAAVDTYEFAPLGIRRCRILLRHALQGFNAKKAFADPQTFHIFRTVLDICIEVEPAAEIGRRFQTVLGDAGIDVSGKPAWSAAVSAAAAAAAAAVGELLDFHPYEDTLQDIVAGAYTKAIAEATPAPDADDCLICYKEFPCIELINLHGGHSSVGSLICSACRTKITRCPLCRIQL
jgi:hypothetical protein